MSGILRHLGLPLLTKELIEQSARKRTYILRVLYSLVLYGVTLWIFGQQLGSWNAAGLSVLGQGRTLYTSMAWLEFGGIFLFLPAMTCGVLTAEKERDTLGLLLLTKLSPWTIVLEKLCSRLVPMMTFVLLSTPLLAVAYSLGGVEIEDITKLMWLLAVTAIQVGAFAVLCSAWFRSTAGSFLGVYLLGPLVLFGMSLLYYLALGPSLTTYLGPWLSEPMRQALLGQEFGSGDVDGWSLSFLPALLNGGELLYGSDAWGVPVSVPQTLLDCVLLSIPNLATSFCYLLVARAILWRRAFLQPRNVLLRLFRKLDSFFQRVNQNRLTRGIVLIRESNSLPLYHPIRWRETAKRSLGTKRYLIRLLIAIEFPVLLFAFWPVTEMDVQSTFAPVYLAEACLWLVATMVLTIQSTGLIGNERSRQTLDVLLTIPVETDELIRQKFAGIWRMIGMLCLPFATLSLFHAWWINWIEFENGFPLEGATSYVLVRAALAVSVYLPGIAWLGFYLSLRCKTQSQAILFAISTITVTCAAPAAIAWYVHWSSSPYQYQYGIQVYGEQTPLGMYVGWLSPAFLLSSRFESSQVWFWMLLHFALIGTLVLGLAWWSKATFARRVGRNDGEPTDEPDTFVEYVAPLTYEERLAMVRRGRVGATPNDERDKTDPLKESQP